MRWKGRRQSENLIDNRGGRRLGKKGGFSVIGLVIAGIMAFIYKDPSYFLGEVGKQVTQQVTQPSQGQYQSSPQEQQWADFTSTVLASTEDVWGEIFEQAGQTYPAPKLELFSGSVQSACGAASAQSGPFYCPADKKVYIDLSFLNEMQRMGAEGDFAFAYVIAHEVGHHISNLTGALPKVHRARSRLSKTKANQLSVLLELQADCYAGVWGHYADNEQNLLEAGDVEEGMQAAQAVGDDTITQGRVSPDNFTHGTAKQRMHWFMVGMESGNVKECNTFEKAGVTL